MSKLREEFEKENLCSATYTVLSEDVGNIDYVEWLESKVEKSREGLKITKSGTVLIGSTVDDGSNAKIWLHSDTKSNDKSIKESPCYTCGTLIEYVWYGQHFCPSCGNLSYLQESKEQKDSDV